MSLMNVLMLYLDDDCRDDVVAMLEKQGVKTSNVKQFSLLTSDSLAACFKTASEATKSIRKIFNHLSKRKKVVFIVTLPNGASAHVDMLNNTHEEQLELIDKAVGVIVTDKTEVK